MVAPRGVLKQSRCPVVNARCVRVPSSTPIGKAGGESLHAWAWDLHEARRQLVRLHTVGVLEVLPHFLARLAAHLELPTSSLDAYTDCHRAANNDEFDALPAALPAALQRVIQARSRDDATLCEWGKGAVFKPLKTPSPPNNVSAPRGRILGRAGGRRDGRCRKERAA